MVNAWSLAASILDGTFDEDYPIMKKKEVDEKTGLWKEPDPVEHSDAYYDYTRNDPNAENPFTDPVDRARAEFVVGGGNTASHENFYGYEPDGLDYEIDLTTANMDGRNPYSHLNYEPKSAHFYKYHEEEILKDI